jgi:CMP-N-acetylneuraminic acid synthetase
MQMPQSIAIIPARGGSKGLPGKNIRPLLGKPLISYNIEAALAAGIEHVYVSTDSAEIGAVAEKFGARVIPRPAELAGDVASSESALLHGLDYVAAEHGVTPDILLFLQCTNPMTRPSDIRGILETLVAEGADCAFSAWRTHYFLWKKDAEGRAIGVNHDPSFRLMRQQREPEWSEAGSMYALTVPGFRQAKHRFYGKVALYEVERKRSLEIDSLEDFELIESIMGQESHG